MKKYVWKQESVFKATCKAWPFLFNFSFAWKDGWVTAATCKYCSLAVIEKLESEMARQNPCGKISESTKNYQKEVYYIHKPNLARNIGDGNSLHKWCKKQIPNWNGKSSIQLDLLMLHNQDYINNLLRGMSAQIQFHIVKNFSTLIFDIYLL